MLVYIYIYIYIYACARAKKYCWRDDKLHTCIYTVVGQIYIRRWYVYVNQQPTACSFSAFNLQLCVVSMEFH